MLERRLSLRPKGEGRPLEIVLDAIRDLGDRAGGKLAERLGIDVLTPRLEAIKLRFA